MNIQKVNLNFNMSKIAYGNNPNAIVLHHAEAPNCSIEDVHGWHRNQGWAGIGYHYFVRKNGEVFKGREDNWIGSHCLGHNQNTIGVCFEGAFNKETMGQTQINAGKELIAYLKSKYGISKVYRHKDLNNTDCPGANFPFAEIININVSSSSTNNTNSSDWLAEYLKSWNWSEWVGKLQKTVGVATDKIVGPITFKACTLLKKGCTGELVKRLQEILKAYGFNCGNIDGIFGDKTYNAVVAFQKSRGLTMDGIVGQNTWRELLGL